MDGDELTTRCAARGVLIEPGDVFFGTSSATSRTHIRIGYSAIASNHINAGVREMRLAWQEMSR